MNTSNRYKYTRHDVVKYTKPIFKLSIVISSVKNDVRCLLSNTVIFHNKKET